MATKSYAFAVGNVRAKETTLLKKQDIEQLLVLKSSAEGFAFLRDKGYAYPDSPDYRIFKDEEQKLWEYIKEVAPDFSVFSAFILGNDFQNIKSVLKCMATSAEYEEYILSPYTVEPKTIEKAVADQNYSLLPADMSEAVKKAAEALFKIGDPQLCDALLDSACMSLKQKKAQELRLPMLSDLIKISVFYENVKAAIRCARANKSAAFCEICLIDLSGLPKKELVSAVLKGTEEVLNLVEKASRYSSAEAVAAFRNSPSEFEKFVDDLIMSVILKAKYIAVGAEPLIAYLQAKLCEIKVARIALNGITVGESEEKVREMLRELYG